jgi:membrane-bound serine protease (ClpP class)
MKIFKSLFVLVAFIATLSFSQENTKTPRQIKTVWSLKIVSTINPATFHTLEKAFKKIIKPENSIFLIQLNTPGGFVSTTKKIVELIGESPVPVVIWIGPEGASATSAGALISSSAHFLYMSPGSNIGAATPIGLGGDIKESDGRSKAINDLVAFTTSLSQLRGRNAKGYELMIKVAKSYTAQQALKENIIDGISPSISDLLKAIDLKKVKLQGREIQIQIDSSLEVKEIEKSFVDELLDIFSNPQTAYLLFLLGAALVYFELQAPGGFIAGGLGVIFLILAAIGFQVLPINWGAFSLIILAFILFILEVYIISYGLLSIAATASLVFGSLILFETSDSYLAVNKTIIFSSALGILSFVGFVAWQMLRYKKNDRSDIFESIGMIGEVFEVQPDYFLIKVSGSFWKAHSKDKLAKGDKVEVISKNKDHLILEIIKTGE